MSRLEIVRAVAAAVCIALVPAAAHAQAQPQQQEYQPSVGQSGKDVVWVPTPEELVERMLKMAQVGKNDFVMDLGSGDGRIAIAAAKKFGATAQGIEYNPDMVDLSNRNAAAAGVGDKVKFMKADIFETDFSKATVITMYLLPGLNLKLRPKILDMRPGTRVVSHAFNMDDWKPDQTANVEGRDAFLWIVPAKVAGNWKLSHPQGDGSAEIELALNQKYQMLDGSKAMVGGKEVPLQAKLSGANITLAFVDGNGAKREFSGRVNGSRMEGSTTAQGGAPIKWSATKVK